MSRENLLDDLGEGTAAMRQSGVEREPAEAWVMSDQLLAAEHFLRSHPAIIGLAAVASTAAIAFLKLHLRDSVSLALTYTLPVALCGYGLGVFAGMMVAVAVSALWVVETLDVTASSQELLMALLMRLLVNMGIVAIAALSAAAARARERYVATQQELTRWRAELVGAFSHDLRSPLTSIAGYADLLRDEFRAGDGVDAIEALDAIVSQVYRVDRLIGDMLGVAHSEASPALQITSVDAPALMAELRAEFEHRPSRTVQLEWEVQSGMPALQTDATKFTSIVRNLVGNAMKFTRHGSVHVGLQYERETDGVRLVVQDTGPGIAAEALPRLFERFYRGPGTGSLDGFGLGLFIVKRFTELLGGTVRVDAELGCGTRFVVTLPRLANQPLPRPAPGTARP